MTAVMKNDIKVSWRKGAGDLGGTGSLVSKAEKRNKRKKVGDEGGKEELIDIYRKLIDIE